MLNARHITMDNVISGYYIDNEKGWLPMPEDEREKAFQLMVDWLIDSSSKRSQIRAELQETKIAYVNNCGILSRLWINQSDKNKPYIEYCAGQNYPSELLYVKKIVAGRRMR